MAHFEGAALRVRTLGCELTSAGLRPSDRQCRQRASSATTSYGGATRRLRRLEIAGPHSCPYQVGRLWSGGVPGFRHFSGASHWLGGFSRADSQTLERPQALDRIAVAGGTLRTALPEPLALVYPTTNTPPHGKTPCWTLNWASGTAPAGLEAIRDRTSRIRLHQVGQSPCQFLLTRLPGRRIPSVLG